MREVTSTLSPNFSGWSFARNHFRASTLSFAAFTSTMSMKFSFVMSIDFVENSIALQFAGAIVSSGEPVNVIGRPAADGTRGRHVRLAADGPQGFTFRKQIEDLGRERFVVTGCLRAMAVELHDLPALIVTTFCRLRF